MLYDIEETRDEVPVDEIRVDEVVENTSESSPESNHEQSSSEPTSDEEHLPEYQKSPRSTNHRVTKWLMGLEPSEDENCNRDLTRTEHILPDINSH